MGMFKRAFDFTNKNIILICLLMIFSLITTVFVSLFKSVSLNVLILYILMLVAFFAGFFNIIKNIIQGNSAKLAFLEGVGEYFLPMLGIGMISFGMYIIFAVLAMQLGTSLAGTKEQVVAALNELMPILQTADTSSLANIEPASAKIYLVIMLSVWIAWGVLSFIILYWVPVLYVDNERNIFKSFYKSVKFLLKNFIKTLCFFVGFVLLLVVTTFLSALAAMFLPLLEFVFFMLSYYLAVVFIFWVFLSYTPESK